MLATYSYANTESVVKLGAETKKYKSSLTKLDKNLKMISVKLSNLDNTLAIPSHAAGEINKLERALKRAVEVSQVTELVPNLKSKGQEYRKNIQAFQPTVQKAREVTDEVSAELVKFHKKIRETKQSVKDIHQKVADMIKKDVPGFHNAMTETQDCVYKAGQKKRECMQDELNSASDDLKDELEKSNKEVLRLSETVILLKSKIANLQKIIKSIYLKIKPVQKLEYTVNKNVIPSLDLYKIMIKDYEVKFPKPNPFKPKKNNSYYFKVAGKEIIIGLLHTMDQVEKKLKGELLAQANKASVKKLAQNLTKKLDRDYKKVMKKLKLDLNFNIKNLSDLHKIDSTLIDPLEDLVSTMKDVKLEVVSLQAVACKKLEEECN